MEALEPWPPWPPVVLPMSCPFASLVQLLTVLCGDDGVRGDECATEDEGQSCAVRAQSGCGVHEARTAL